MEYTGATFQAIAREAASAAEHIAIGVTALGKANYAQQAYYPQAFFALSIGFERSAKLAFIVHHALENAGRFPSGHAIRRYGHNLRELLDMADQVAVQLPARSVSSDRLPRTPIHDAIISILNDFASNVTRYYNIDVITWGGNVRRADDPIRAWYERVTEPALEKHWSPVSRARVERNARAVAEQWTVPTLMRRQSETGLPLNTAYEASLATGRAQVAARYVRMYVLQIGRFISHLMSDLGFEAQVAQIEGIPYLSEFYGLFNNSDAYFRRRATWSLYRR